MVPIMVISLFFGVDYHFLGKENMEIDEIPVNNSELIRDIFLSGKDMKL